MARRDLRDLDQGAQGRLFKSHYDHWGAVFEKIGTLDKEYTGLQSSRLTSHQALSTGVRMLECLVGGAFSPALTNRPMPVPLLLLVGALQDKARGQATLLLDGPSKKGRGKRSRYGPWAYRRIKAFVAAIMEAAMYDYKPNAKKPRPLLGITDGPLQPSETAKAIASTLDKAGFTMVGHDGKQMDQKRKERWQKTIERWHRDARNGKTTFQSQFDATMVVFEISYMQLNLPYLLAILSEVCHVYRSPT
jgi:hypothetical protein